MRSKHTLPVPPNVLACQFDKTLPNKAWASNITYTSAQQLAIFSAVLNLHSRNSAGRAMAREMHGRYQDPSATLG